MHWLPFLRTLVPSGPPAGLPVPSEKSDSTPDYVHCALTPDFTPASIVYDADLAQWIQDEFLGGVEAALDARGCKGEVPEGLVARWDYALEDFSEPLDVLDKTSIRGRFVFLGHSFRKLVAALDVALGIDRDGKVVIDTESVLTTRMHDTDGVAAAFFQQFDAVVGTLRPGERKPVVELTVDIRPASASTPAQPDGTGGRLFTRMATALVEEAVLSAERLAQLDADVQSFLSNMIHGARFHRNRLFLYFDGLTYGVGAITCAVTLPSFLATERDPSAPSSPSTLTQSPHPFSVLLSPPVILDSSAADCPADDDLPTVASPPSLILVVLAALYPHLIDQDLLDARIRQLVDVAKSPERAAALDKSQTAGVAGIAESERTDGASLRALRSSTGSASSIRLIWPDGMSAELTPIDDATLQVRFDALQNLAADPASDSDEDITPPPSRPSAMQTLAASDLRTPVELGQLLALKTLIHSSKRSFVYSGTLGERRIVAKIGRRDWEDLIVADAVASMLAYHRQAAVPQLLGVYEGLDPADGRRIVVAVYPKCGDSPDAWVRLPTRQRIELLLDLVYLHQRVHLEHGDAAPRNTLVDDASGTKKWIDLSDARAHASCKGVKCWELSNVCDEMRLWEEQEAVQEAANARGLRW